MLPLTRKVFITKLRFRYQTYEVGELDIHIRSLKNKQQFNDDSKTAENLGITSALWPIFGVVWDSGQILAQLMYGYEVKGKKILEIGCGLGMASLVLNQRLAQITSTDHHPEAEGFLKENVKLNGGNKIPFFRADWTTVNPCTEKFDLIIGSDLLYERGHGLLLSKFIEQYANDKCEVIIVDPGRGYLNAFTREMESLSYSHSREEPKDQSFLDTFFKGFINHYRRK